ncbi:hypothetical protein GCM10009836_06830 [Pseudonocardia ailaonensis]|uniref:Uncharacterized protein n=1 Tax=Pseudonocardia ailaonensis TaxID=367279 RepID=A0ABN2MPN9_9PSEU
MTVWMITGASRGSGRRWWTRHVNLFGAVAITRAVLPLGGVEVREALGEGRPEPASRHSSEPECDVRARRQRVFRPPESADSRGLRGGGVGADGLGDRGATGDADRGLQGA